MLAKLALRLAAIEALCPDALKTSGPWPTIAANRVYDTRLDPIDAAADIQDNENRPIIAVYTERDHYKAFEGAKYPPEEFTCELVVEMAILATAQLTVTDQSGNPETVGSVDVALSDQQREGMLDMLDGVVCYLLRGRQPGQDSPPSAALYNKLATEVHEVLSEPQRSADRTDKLAMRTRKFTVKTWADRWPTGDIARSGTLAFTTQPYNGQPVYFCDQAFRFVAQTAIYTPQASRGEIAIGAALTDTIANLLAFLQSAALFFPALGRATFALAQNNANAIVATAATDSIKGEPYSVRMGSNAGGATWTPTPLAGVDLLPEPLRTVAASLPTTSSGYALCQSLVALTPAPAQRQPLNTIRSFIGEHGAVPSNPNGTDSDEQSNLLT